MFELVRDEGNGGRHFDPVNRFVIFEGLGV